MPYGAKIILDSVSPAGRRLTTMEVEFPRIVLAEFNTHRVFSRNSASSRAIPVAKMLAKVKDDPFVPIYWGKNQRGMQAHEEFSGLDKLKLIDRWLSARDKAVAAVEELMEIGVHKQIANRLLEPFLFHKVLVSATEWENFFALRRHPDAQPEIRFVADLMHECLQESTPTRLDYGEWHMPLTNDRDELLKVYQMETLKEISAGRCCRISYETHDGVRDPERDIEMHNDLVRKGHMSPLEHIATPATAGWHHKTGNYSGWVQYRKMIPHEENFGAREAS